ncbi:MAG: hypothetical protein GW893_05175 [Armatimonadetes bacterium]|nr:hypothetical protein [Armatimonadota bacterium]PIX41797.1 MAG: hypothetical protein COZ56_10995 [Armatimonadetes bacterium CG_4_8_14_3_um_filter_58_9]PJB73824.1 MAG: hypothetical protein CO095_05380 [Armatimonadetes bacterium CG_4_9_14_3_um_filter_58_7]
MHSRTIIACLPALLLGTCGVSVARPSTSNGMVVDLAVEKVEVTPAPVLVGQTETILVTP